MCSRSVGILVNQGFRCGTAAWGTSTKVAPPCICRDLQPHRIHVGRNFTVWIPRVDSKDPSALHGEGRNFWEDGAPNSLPWTTQHLGGLESALVAFENRHIRSESLGGVCEAVQELVREIPAICGSYPVCVRPQQTTSLCVVDSHHPCLPYLWSSHGQRNISRPLQRTACFDPPQGAVPVSCAESRSMVGSVGCRWSRACLGTILHDAARAKVKM